MPNSKTARIATTFTAAAWLTCASVAFADTTVKSPVLEGTGVDSAVRLERGCKQRGGVEQPIIAESVLFPSLSPQVTASDGSVIGDLSQVITQGSLAGLLKPIGDTTIFQSQQLKLDSLGNVIGFSATDGTLAVGLQGRLPFQFTGPTFVKTSCGARLLVQLAVADICATDSIRADAVTLWIPNNGSQYAALGAASHVEGIGFLPTLIVNRDLTANPLPPVCGAGLDITVTPSAADIDTNFKIPAVWASSPAGTLSDSVSVVEYYNANLNHYFITWVPDEIGKLDDGTVIKGWTRTGRTFRAYRTAQPGTSPVCRFYIPPELGDSHFYGRGTAECDATAQKNPSFVAEDMQFMFMYLPAEGDCAANTNEIFRVFSNRVDANHRYMADTQTRDQMVEAGWLAEGDGPDLVVMCAPQ